jgi:hypothetical protein
MTEDLAKRLNKTLSDDDPKVNKLLNKYKEQ